MFCSKCGKQFEGSESCPYCGAEAQQDLPQAAGLQEVAQVSVPEVPQVSAEVPQKRSKGRVWVFIGIAAGVAAIAAAVLFLFILVPPTIEGQWYNEDRGEVLVFNNDGTMQSIHMAGTNDANYEYDRGSGKGTITLGTFSYGVQYADDMLDITDMGVFTRAAKEFDADEFMDEYGDSVIGLWFDPDGEGIIDLHDDGTYDLITFGRNFDGKYAQGESDFTITYKYINMDIDVAYTLDKGVLKCNADYANTSIKSYVRDYKEQKGEETFYEEALGKWVSASVGVTIELKGDCTGIIYDATDSLTGTFKYEPVGNVGFFAADGGNEVLFLVSGDILSMADTLFTRAE